MRLAKYQALGNDFLVVVDLDGRQPVDEATARALCDRHLGVGADGLIRATSGRDRADVTMELRNADGGRAETSGNGLRCLARALVDAGVVSGRRMVVATDAGTSAVEVHADGTVTVDMGVTRMLADGELGRAIEGVWAHRYVDMGNPHLVLARRDLTGVAVEQIGPEAERALAGGINVEFVATGPGPDELTMRVWERGVGETRSCGSGACAAAAAFRDLKEVGDRVVVHQPGGDLIVDLGGDRILLTGPAELVCTVEVPEARAAGGGERCRS